MSDRDLVLEQLRTAFFGPAWHGPAVLEVLGDVTTAQAAARPIRDAHTIWELALHLTGTYGLVLRRLNGDGRNLTPAEDWPLPPPEPTDENWQATLGLVREAHGRLLQRLEAGPWPAPGEPLVAESPYSAFVQMIGVTQHDLYHAGQIAVLKKALPVP